MKHLNSGTLSPIPRAEEILSFGEFIRAERKRRKLSQVEFAKLAGIAQLTLGKIELQRTEPSRLHSKVVLGLARALQLEPETLRSFARGENFSWKVVKICDQCWKPATPPDSRWTQADSYFCAKCGGRLRERCTCGQPIVLEGKFCLNCGKNYSRFRAGER